MWRYYSILRQDIKRRKYLCCRDILSCDRNAVRSLAKMQKQELFENENDTVKLSRIMETHLGAKIKLKSKAHDLGIKVFIKYRKKDKREILGMVRKYDFRVCNLVN